MLQPQLMTTQKLRQLVNSSELSEEFGGSLKYDHEKWLDTRLQYERFLREARAVDTDLDVQMGQVRVLDKIRYICM